MSTLKSKVMLVILDGFGVAKDPNVSAIDQANMPYYKSLISVMPNTQLSASGEDVGLPENQFGNSEVGHLNIGAGRIVWQALSRINKDIREGGFYTNPIFLESIQAAKKSGYIHVMGLFSDGGVHSHINHLYAILTLAKKEGLKEVYVHAFTDGRDTSPHSGLSYLKEFQLRAKKIGIIYQQDNLLPDFTSLENIYLASLAAGNNKKISLLKAKNLLKKVGLLNRSDHYPSQLSGGEKQRVSIARAVINDPQIILADEPTGSLDLETAKEIFELLKNQINSNRLIIFATHNRFFANKADCLLEMVNGNIKTINA